MASQASYDELIKQVLNLQKENTNLRRELRNSSSHIRDMEFDSLAVKDSLVRLTVGENDIQATAAAAEVANDVTINDTCPPQQILPTAVPTLSSEIFDHNYSSPAGKFRYCRIYAESKKCKLYLAVCLSHMNRFQ